MTDIFPFDTMTTSGQIKHRVLKSQLGDGYTQRAGDGINTKKQSWPFTATGTKAYIESIMAWLDAKGGFTAFYWTPPVGTQDLFVCEEYDVTGIDIDTFSISAKFDPA